MDFWDPSVGSPEVPVNAALVAVSHVATYAMRARTTSGLDWGYYGGRYSGVLFADGVLALTDDSDNYIVAPLDGGAPVVTDDDANWLNAASDDPVYGRLYRMTAAGGLVSADTIEDHRAGKYGVSGGSGSGGGGGGTEKVVLVDVDNYDYLEADHGKLHSHYFATDYNSYLPPQFAEGWFADLQNRGDGTLTVNVGVGSPTSLIDGTNTVTLSPGQGMRVCAAADGNYYTSRGGAGSGGAVLQLMVLQIGDQSTPITTGTKFTFHPRYDMSLADIPWASLVTAQASGSAFTVDIKEGGVSIFSTLITFDNTEKTSATATTPAALSDAALAADSVVTVEVTQVGTPGAVGLVLTIPWYFT